MYYTSNYLILTKKSTSFYLFSWEFDQSGTGLSTGLNQATGKILEISVIKIQ